MATLSAPSAFAASSAPSLSWRTFGPISGGQRTLDVLTPLEGRLLAGQAPETAQGAVTTGLLLHAARFRIGARTEVVLDVACSVPWRLRLDGQLVGAGTGGAVRQAVALDAGNHQLVLKHVTSPGKPPCTVQVQRLDGVALEWTKSDGVVWAAFGSLERPEPTALSIPRRSVARDAPEPEALANALLDALDRGPDALRAVKVPSGQQTPALSRLSNAKDVALGRRPVSALLADRVQRSARPRSTRQGADLVTDRPGWYRYDRRHWRFVSPVEVHGVRSVGVHIQDPMRFLLTWRPPGGVEALLVTRERAGVLRPLPCVPGRQCPLPLDADALRPGDILHVAWEETRSGRRGVALREEAATDLPSAQTRVVVECSQAAALHTVGREIGAPRVELVDGRRRWTWSITTAGRNWQIAASSYPGWRDALLDKNDDPRDGGAHPFWPRVDGAPMVPDPAGVHQPYPGDPPPEAGGGIVGFYLEPDGSVRRGWSVAAREEVHLQLTLTANGDLLASARGATSLRALESIRNRWPGARYTRSAPHEKTLSIPQYAGEDFALTPFVSPLPAQGRRVRLTYKWPAGWDVRLPGGTRRAMGRAFFELTVGDMVGGAEVVLTTPPRQDSVRLFDYAAWWRRVVSQRVAIRERGEVR